MCLAVIQLIILTAGHFRPLCAFASKVVQDRPDIAVTLMITGSHKMVQGEIDRCTADDDAKSKANIRCARSISTSIPNLSVIFIDSSILAQTTLISLNSHHSYLVHFQITTKGSYAANLFNVKPQEPSFLLFVARPQLSLTCV